MPRQLKPFWLDLVCIRSSQHGGWHALHQHTHLTVNVNYVLVSPPDILDAADSIQ
jgi:hypothetical protein